MTVKRKNHIFSHQEAKIKYFISQHNLPAHMWLVLCWDADLLRHTVHDLIIFKCKYVQFQSYLLIRVSSTMCAKFKPFQGNTVPHQCCSALLAIFFEKRFPRSFHFRFWKWSKHLGVCVSNYNFIARTQVLILAANLSSLFWRMYKHPPFRVFYSSRYLGLNVCQIPWVTRNSLAIVNTLSLVLILRS